MKAMSWSSRVAWAGSLCLALWVLSGAVGVAAQAETRPDSGATRAREMLDRARDAVRSVGSLHRVCEYRDGDRVSRQEEWQEGRLYRREDNWSTFLLGDRWAVQREKRSEVAMAACRRDADDWFFLASEELIRGLDLERVAAAYSQVVVSEHIQRRTIEGRERLGVTVIQSPGAERTTATESYYEVTMVFWIDVVTWLPMEAETVNRDQAGKALATSRSVYEYDLDLPEDWFSVGSVLGAEAVIVGWEDLRELSERGPIASSQIQVGGRDVLVEVRAVEALPRNHILIVGFLDHSPEWLGAHLIRQDGRKYWDYSLAWHRRIMSTPWFGGGSGPPRFEFAMVFAPKGHGSRGVSVPAPRLTWRAWGLFQYPVQSGAESGESRWEEEDLVVSLALPVPEGPPLVHELARGAPE